MKLLKEVSSKEVKRAFAVGHLIKQKKGRNPRISKLSKDEFRRRLANVKKKVKGMSNRQLDAVIRWRPRIDAYEKSVWHLGSFNIAEVGVWNRAGGLPLSWTNRSLKETAERIEKSLKTARRLRRPAGYRSIQGILMTNVADLQQEKYLLPIVFKGNTGTRGRHRLRKQMKGDLDDGCMRSIALAVNGLKVIRAYIGMPK